MAAQENALAHLLAWQKEDPQSRGVAIAAHNGVWYVDLVDNGRPAGAANERFDKAAEEAMGRMYA